MENLVLPFMNEGQMAHSSKTPHFMGVNSENKWSNDWRGSNECLLTVQKDISDQHTELAQINAKVMEIRNFLKLYKERHIAVYREFITYCFIRISAIENERYNNC
jgi:hypothetical protein